MDLPCPQWQKHVAQKWTALDSDQKESFTSLSEIDDVFKFALSMIIQDDLDFLLCLSAEKCIKSEDQASKSRERGNSSFKSREYTSAALHYSQGICLAPRSSQQLSLCHANRSAALCHLQLYQDSLFDIGMALKSGYPSHLSHKLQDRRALCLRHLAAAQEAKADHPSQNHNAPDGDGRQAGEHYSLGICPRASVGFTLERGRHLVAKEIIAPGVVVLTDRPYSLVLIPGRDEEQKEGELFGTEHTFCHRCLAKTFCLIPCDYCSYSRYCSVACQNEAWLEHHRWECHLGGDLVLMGVMAQLAVRVTLKAGIKSIQMARHPSKRKEPDSDCTTNYCHANVADCSHGDDSYLTLFNLMHHLSHHSAALRFLAAVTVATLYLKISARTGPAPPGSQDLRRPSGGTGQSEESSGEKQEEAEDSEWGPEHWMMGSAVLRHLLQLRCNAQAITALQDTGPATSSVQSSCEVRIATALFPTLSFLNHSCSPNTSLAFTAGAAASPGPDLSEDFTGNANRGVTATIRAAKAISPGQEIFHCYGPHSSRMKTQERRRLLFEQYNFHCQCEACALQQDKKERNEAEENNIQYETKLQCAKCKAALKKRKKDKESGCACSKCGHFVSSSEVDHKLRGISVNLETAVQLLERDKPDEALRLLKQTQVNCGSFLSDTHPLQGELEDVTARAFATMGDWGNAAVHLEQSATAIGAQFGEDSIELGRQLFKLTQLHFNGGARSAALSVIPKVRRLLRLHCGPECDELQELRAMERCLSR
ncbi:SET and MYND domain-containing protein 4 [Eucyclogobius newberryi]|uniref:SET and MYND domain-containing protein 4 n=1 Tax=Eucyclogobius newberryi TaxID=166745 RepID=UPI003B5BF37C